MPPWSEPYWLFFAVVCAAVGLGRYWAWIESKEDRGEGVLGKWLRVDLKRPMGAWEYLTALTLLTIGGGIFVFIVGLSQGYLPLNPESLKGLTLLQAGHLAVSVITHTNWQPFAPQATYSIFTQMVAVNTQNLVQAGVGIAAMRALIRAMNRQEIGNAWAGVFRGVVWLHLPLWLALGGIQIANGVPQNPFAGSIEGGPVASFASLKVLAGGAGYFAENFASIIENPNRLTNFWGLVIFIALPLGVFLGAGRILKHTKSSELMALAMLAVLFGAASLSAPESKPTDRYSTFSQSLWLNTTAGSSNGSNNTTLERFEPAQRLTSYLMLLGGIPFPPAVGFGVATVIFFLLMTVYLASLMVGRSPAMWGFRLDVRMLTMAVIAITANQVITLLAATLAYLSPDAVAAIREHGAYGASVLLYTLATAVQNNGCAYSMAISHEGLLQLSMVLMALGRFFVIAPPIIMAGEFLKQKDNPPAAVVIGPCWPLTVGFWVVLVVMGSVLAFMPLMFLTAVGEALP